MDAAPFSRFKRIIFSQSLLHAQKCSQREVALWRTGLLLCYIHFCSCLEEQCVLGVVGQSVSLPCLYPQLLRFVNFSIEWRRDGEVVLRSVFENSRNVEELSAESEKLSADAAQTGNFSLELPGIDLKEPKMNYSLFIISKENQSAAVCTVCLQKAASFSRPQLHREEAVDRGGETAFFCHSIGGFPEPRVHWLINNTMEPPEGSVRTVAVSLPHSQLYNVTSYLTVNISKESRVSCIIENLPMNETFTSTSYGVPDSPMVGRASEAMWIFSTALCAVVGVMVAIGVAYQIHLDKISKKKKLEYQRSKRGYKRRPHKEETEVTEQTEVLKVEPKETGV